MIDGQRIEERIGTPEGCSAGEGLHGFPKAVSVALAWAKQQAVSVAAASDIANAKKIPTVRLAVEAYVDMRKARANRGGSEGALKFHVMGDQGFAGRRLGQLEAQNV